MAEEKKKPFVRHLRGYIEFTGHITCRTGLLIGGGDVGLEIGGIDKSVIRDPVSGDPYIPGTSLKGKLRALVEKDRGLPSERSIEPGYRHECNDIGAALQCCQCRLFGSTAEGDETKGNRNFPGTLLVRDSLLETGQQVHMEYKMENTLDRLTAAATPRTFERVPPGVIFKLNVLWRIEEVSCALGQPETGGSSAVEGAEGATTRTPRQPPSLSYKTELLRNDLETLLRALRLLEWEGLGSSTSRGYGRVDISISKLNVITEGGSKTEDVLREVFPHQSPRESTDMPSEGQGTGAGSSQGSERATGEGATASTEKRSIPQLLAQVDKLADKIAEKLPAGQVFADTPKETSPASES